MTQAIRRLQHLQRFLLPARHAGTGYAACQVPAAQKIHQNTQDNDVPYPLEEREVFSFLENTLGMKQPREYLSRDRQGFLDAFSLLMNVKMPFTNISMVSKCDMTSMTCPTLEECKEYMFNLQGGNCYYINIFVKALLDVLGFKTFHVGAVNPGEALFESHVSTIVTDLTFPGSQHLVDPGTIRPLYKAIPLDFEDESPIYQFNYMKVKFFKRDHGILLSCSQVQKPKRPSPEIFEHRGLFWKVELTYRLQLPSNRKYWLEKMKYLYSFPSQIPHIFQNVGLFGQIGDRCILTGFGGHGMLLKYQHADPKQSEIKALSMDEYFALMEKEFPQFPREMIQRALVNTEYMRNMYSY